MATYTVKGCSFKKNLEVTTPEGLKTFALYNLLLDTGTEAVDAEWKTLPSTPEPAVDSQIDGTLELTEYGWKFKKGKRDNLQKPNYQAAVAPKPNTGRDSFRKHPAEVAGARRAHAQHMALMELAIISRDVSFDFKMLDDDSYIRTKIDWWDQDARDASEKAEEE